MQINGSGKQIVEPAARQTFTLEVWLDNSPLNHQAVSRYPTSAKTGYVGIEIRSPSEPLPSEDHAAVRDSSFPESLFFTSSTNSSRSKGEYADVVFVQQWGEIQYAREVPGEGSPIQELPFTGNFSTVDFTYWPDRKTYEALEFEPPRFIQGIFLACPGTVGGKGSDKHILDGQFTATFDSLVTESIDSWKVPGLSIAVIQDDEVCAKGNGFANYPDVQWKAPVSSLIRDDLVLSDPRYTEEVTVEDNFSHRSRLPE
ncbi:uncharacterized protein K444DRAFT_669634 [Hyaloscypha bicolor E]|uniref:Uncharacterized protein n=1 Tax=Hyaloscypha bicolor E TaxID=1095630 RepID=A0A2J6SMG2_9HELO|nr:uncharacterized protein K444DRAFT_669634 [Hyaloscypha bicolor E]PMD51959.1 hypothetical protein K444DRAFT_669634 [Hyaloscypha bicolor E]